MNTLRSTGNIGLFIHVGNHLKSDSRTFYFQSLHSQIIKHNRLYKSGLLTIVYEKQVSKLELYLLFEEKQ